MWVYEWHREEVKCRQGFLLLRAHILRKPNRLSEPPRSQIQQKQQKVIQPFCISQEFVSPFLPKRRIFADEVLCFDSKRNSIAYVADEAFALRRYRFRVVNETGLSYALPFIPKMSFSMRRFISRHSTLPQTRIFNGGSPKRIVLRTGRRIWMAVKPEDHPQSPKTVGTEELTEPPIFVPMDVLETAVVETNQDREQIVKYSGLRGNPLSCGVNSATEGYDLPSPVVAARNIVPFSIFRIDLSFD